MATEGASCPGKVVARVVPLLKVKSLGDRSFDYLIPAGLSESVRAGSVVGIQFGNRRARGVVLDIGERPDDGLSGLKSVESVEADSVSRELLDLSYQVATRYVVPLETCLRLVVPPLPVRGGAGGQARDTTVFAVEATKARADDSVAQALTEKQRILLDQIPSSGIRAAEACRSAGVGRSVMRALVTKGFVGVGEAPVRDEAVDPDATCADESLWPTLSAEQDVALSLLASDLREPVSRHRQLWGATGSGKTEVYLRLIAKVLSKGHGVILLVPEIALTPMMVGRVRERFGERVGVLHSGLSSGRRRREYHRIASGEARVVVGARSAVFAPVWDLRLIIIDESHDTSYKQEETPGYHARAVGLMRLERTGGLLVEGSASPAVEAMGSPSELIRMTERVRGRLPSVESVDMRHESGGALLAGSTREALRQVILRDEQAIVLLNRRGYSGHIHCDMCGHVMMCEDCELSLTYHDHTKSLVCHHCGRSYVQPSVCPQCERAPMVRGVPGTERLAEQLGRIVPREKLFRLDSDVLTSGSRVQGILDAFSQTRPALLVGTQMVAKGHDFPDVTLVVVADADTGLYVPDFRAAERTFQLLVQVSGRAGRADIPGKVVVQTWNPDVPCIRMALDREEEAFYLRELAIRERLGYPPFTELVRLLLVGERPEQVRRAAEHLADSLARHFEVGEVRGPARLASLRGRSRWHVVLATGRAEKARAIAAQASARLREPYRSRGVNLVVEVDPYSFV